MTSAVNSVSYLGYSFVGCGGNTAASNCQSPKTSAIDIAGTTVITANNPGFSPSLAQSPVNLNQTTLGTTGNTQSGAQFFAPQAANGSTPILYIKMDLVNTVIGTYSSFHFQIQLSVVEPGSPRIV